MDWIILFILKNTTNAHTLLSPKYPSLAMPVFVWNYIVGFHSVELSLSIIKMELPLNLIDCMLELCFLQVLFENLIEKIFKIKKCIS